MTAILYLGSRDQFRVLSDALSHFDGVLEDHAKEGDQDAAVLLKSVERLGRAVRKHPAARLYAKGIAMPYADYSVAYLALDEYADVLEDFQGDEEDVAHAKSAAAHIIDTQALRFPEEYLRDHPERRYAWLVGRVIGSMAENYQQDAHSFRDHYNLEEGEDLEWDSAVAMAWDNLHTVQGVDGWEVVVDDWLYYNGEEDNDVYADVRGAPKRSEWSDKVLSDAMMDSTSPYPESFGAPYQHPGAAS